ncbi:filamentous hemagglutinin N-terminal domain-containing protein, partial [Sandarakinorhabdus sp.]|uniref:filamentous hemagglutinin N-terminal domain-containing protein n=1 Tax=Sandarakinorhabdus sp. TaxID=1916663 RepID=UPI00286EA359
MISLSKPMMRIGVSGAALAMGLMHLPVMAQTAAILRASAGLTTPVVSPSASLPRPGAVAPNVAGMTSASARALANQAAAANATSLAVQANQAARATAQALAQTVPNGLIAGGLVPVTNPTTAALDPTGLRVWQGASAPVKSGSNAAPTVTITQTSARALLSWDSFNVGRTTTLEFKQQPDWIVVNRIVANIDPTTGRIADPGNLRPSQILGTVKADGTVLVLNQNGVMFGATAQVNTRSLLVSSLELGSNNVPGASGGLTVPSTLAQRNTSFLQSGLLASNALVSAMSVFNQGGTAAVEAPGREGKITIDAGAAIASASGGFVIIAAPDISNAGQLRSEQGQVSLQSGRNVFAVASTGAAGSADPEARGLVLSSTSLTADTIVNAATGLIEAPRGLVSLGTTVTGTITSAGVLSSTTSVARNGKIVLSGAAVTLAPGATIAITPDSNGETIPQSAESVAAFKRSVIEIGGAQVRGVVSPSQISIGSGALIYAPSARVSIGATNDSATVSVLDDVQGRASSLLVDDGAVIDVGGIKDFIVPASRNSVQITPVKRNELRDTPNYRETTTDGSFTLNGATILVDPRLSGVRADGVAWIGSPLIEAGSFFAQVGVTSAELMTKGGDLTLGVRSFAQGSSQAAPNVTIRPRASIDVSGGWVSYASGVVETSRLRTADGRIVSVGAADPNDNFVAVVGAITAEQPRFGASTTFGNQVAQPTDLEPGYTEGRDAGSLTIKASSTTLAGAIHAEAFAGTRQIAAARPGTIASTIASDGRTLQSAPSQLPSGGLLKIAAIGTDSAVQAGGADIIVYRASSATPARPAAEILLSDAFVSGLGLSGLTLQTSGRISFAAGSTVALQPGGALFADAGRTIRLDGTISVPSGRIAARTYEVIPGSIFRTDDDLPDVLAPDGDTGAGAPRLFDIEVNGLLSARGRWSNDYLVTNGVYLGRAYADGGSVSLEVAPRVLIPIGDDSEFSADFSGSLRVNAGARIDVSAGGYVRPDGTLDLTAKGGDVALVNATVYASLLNRPNLVDLEPRSVLVDAPSFITTPDFDRQSSLIPRSFTAEVTIAPGSIVGQGFTGGGVFTLVTPDLNFGARAGESGTALPLDFFASSGFSAFSLTTFTSRLLPNVFSNGIAGNIALLDTETATVKAGETLLLTQSLINSLLTDGDVDAVRNLATDGDIKALLGTAVPVDAWDRRAVDLRLAGLTELNVAAGGTITASDGAVLTASRLLNAGTIRLPGGTIRQNLTLPVAYLSLTRPAIAVSGLPGDDGLATLFGDRDANGLFDENAPNALRIRASASANAPILSNAALTTANGFNRQVYFTAAVGAADGIVLTAGSITDVSGTSIRNPRATARPGGDQKIEGRIVNGGTIETVAAFISPDLVYAEQPLFGVPRFVNESGGPVTERRNALRLTAAAGATIDLRGAADRYDLETALGIFTTAPVWSDAGALTLNGGGTIAGSTVLASGGAATAEGGALTWLNPVLRQTDSAGQAADIVAADQIMAAGFDTFTALNQLTTLGDARLTLGRGFYLTARAFDGDVSTLNSYRASLATTGALAISAPYIQLESPQQSVQPFPGLPGASGTVTLNAGTLDIIGSIYADSSVSALTINATGDVRLTGVQPAILGIVGTSALPVSNSLTGQFVVTGDLTITAAQIYPTTGTGSLQQDINALRLGQTPLAAPYLLASTGTDATIRLGRAAGPTPATPFSAGGNLLVQAANIEQRGVLRVPLGRLVLGSNTPLVIGTSFVPATVPATRSLLLGNDSITSVSANGLVIPYGTTTDLIEYFFTPTSDGRLFAPPAGELRLSGDSVAVDAAASVDASGGGDLYAYEFAAGVGGSRDVLSRFNSDPFSSNNGFQFPDGRQVYAIVPSLSAAGAAPIDPIYSSDYATLYAPSDAGRRVFLEAAPGLAAGWYTLLPARYALLTGGLRVVENIGEGPPALGQSAVLRDGSIIVGGRYGIAGTQIESSQRRTFTVQSQATFRKFSSIQLTPASATFGNLATRDGLAVPQLPADAARLVLAPLTALAINTRFLTDPAPGGRGSQVDISGNDFEIVVSGAPDSPAGVVRLTTRDFANLNAASLLIGGLRRDNVDGTTSILASARTIRVANGAADPLTAPEILLAVDGVGSAITIADGSVIRATGNLVDPRTGDYIITAAEATGQTGIGGLVRVANGAERRLSRPGDLALANSLEDSIISIGESTLSGQSILLDGSRDLVITDDPLTQSRPLITASSLVLGGDDVFFTSAPSGYRGLVITPELETQFAAAQRLTIVTKSIIGFAAGTHSFNDLVIDARGIRPYGQATTPPPFPRDDQFDVAVADPAAPIAVTLNTRQFSYSNSDLARTPCGGVATIAACGSSGNTLTINATAINLGSGSMGIFGFDESVRLVASAGIFAEGVGTLDVGIADLRVSTPFFGDRALVADPRSTTLQPSLTVFTSARVLLDGPGAAPATAAAAPGSTLAFGTSERPIESFSANGLTLRATAGILDVRATGDIVATGTTVLATPGFAKLFGDAADQVSVAAPGGTLSLVSAAGNIALGSGVTLSIGGGNGNAGTLQLSAARGGVTLPGTIDATAPGGKASLAFDSGTTGFDLSGFVAGQGRAFTGDVRIRTGIGNLVLAFGQTLAANQLRLTADSGRVEIAGTIDTSGINGGKIGLYGTSGVTLAATALLDASADGYAANDTRAATGGTIE